MGARAWHAVFMRLRLSSGYSLAELTVTVALVGILLLTVGGKLLGQQSSSRASEMMGRLDGQANSIMTWAAQQDSFDTNGSRLGVLTSTLPSLTTNQRLQPLASAIEGKDISDSGAGNLLSLGGSASAVPSDGRTMVFTDSSLEGERIRLTRCEDQYFSNGDDLCARVDLYPWGNNKEDAATVTYRFLQCSGAGCGTTPPVYLSEGCSRWPEALPQQSGQAGSTLTCPSI